MSKASRFKELKDELRQLFEQHVSEQEAYDQLKEDPRFDTIRLAKVTTIYEQFRNEKASKKKNKAANQEEIPMHIEPVIPSSIKRLQRTEQLSFIRSIVECDHNQHQCLRVLNSASIDGRFFVLEGVNPMIDDESNASLTDTFSNKSSRIKLPLAVTEHGYEFTFSPLAYDTGLLIERSGYEDTGEYSTLSVSLLEMDWANKGVRKLQTLTIEEQERLFILQDLIVDEMDQARFLLRYWLDDRSLVMKRGTIVENEIFFEDDILVANRDPSFDLLSLVGDTLYTFDLVNLMLRNATASICTVNLNQIRETTQFNLVRLPEQFSYSGGMIVACLTPNRLFMAVRSNKTHSYGIVWTNCETREWTEMDFCTERQITSIRFMVDGGLLVIQTTENITEITQGVHSMQKALYRIPLKTPEKLANLAWFSLVRSKSRIPNIDPYDEARKYLPFNSEIQAPFEV